MSKHGSSFSLASLFLLVACAALLLASTRTAVAKWTNNEFGLFCVVVGAGLGSIVGAWVGFLTHRWFRGSTIGFLAGAVVGGMGGAQMGAPPDFIIIGVGMLTLIALSLALRPTLSPERFEPPTSGLEKAPGDASSE